jgi:nicotinamide mononucleotide (NMN) deamidase PncC
MWLILVTASRRVTPDDTSQLTGRRWLPHVVLGTNRSFAFATGAAPPSGASPSTPADLLFAATAAGGRSSCHRAGDRGANSHRAVRASPCRLEQQRQHRARNAVRRGR